jgi:hypothetical protein
MVDGTATAVEVIFRCSTFRAQLALKTVIFILIAADGCEFKLRAKVGSLISGAYEYM